MVTSGFKRLFSQWYRNSYFHSSSAKAQSGVVIDKFNLVASLPPTNEKLRMRDILLPNIPYWTIISVISIILKFVLNNLLWFLARNLLEIYYFFNGTYFQVLRSRRTENYEKSARVLNVLGKYRFDTFVILSKLSDFLLSHVGFEHPETVLRDEVSLYEVNKHRAVFIETAPGVEVWRGKYNSFHAIAQLEHAKRVIILPIESFYKLAKQLGDPKGKIVFITNTARCGSTLLSRIFEETDEFVSLSEPTGINYLRTFVGMEHDVWVQYHAKAIIRMLCKPTYVDNFAIKITPNSTKIVPLLKELYPDAKFLFIYRDALPVCKSMYKIWKELPMGRLNLIVARFCQWIYLPLLNWSGYYDKVDTANGLKLCQGYGQGVFLWANVIGMYRRFRKSGINVGGVKYEHLVKDKELALNKLFKFCDVPERCVKPAMRAFECDSQENSLLSRNILKKTLLPEFTDQMKAEVNKICSYYNLPEIGESCVLEGTLTGENID